MSKETKPITLELEDGMILTVNSRGAICEGEGDDEQIHVTAGELDRIVERATFLHDLPKGPKGPGTVEGGHDVVFCVGDDSGENPGKLGDVYTSAANTFRTPRLCGRRSSARRSGRGGRLLHGSKINVELACSRQAGRPAMTRHELRFCRRQL